MIVYSMRLLGAAVLALGLAACQHRVRYRSTPPPTDLPSEAAGPAEKPAPAPTPTVTAPASGPATQAEEPDAKAKRSKWAQEEAARLIRESVPLTKEVADAIELPLPHDRQELQNLRIKAKTAHENLTTARELYLRVELDSQNQVELAERIKKLNDLISVMKGALKRIDSAL